MGRALILIIFSIFLVFSSFGESPDDCGLVGDVESRLKDCNEKINDEFSILTRIQNKLFYYQHKTKLTWYSPEQTMNAHVNYFELTSICKKPYYLPRLKELELILENKNLPFKFISNEVILKNFSVYGVKKQGGAVVREKLDVFQHYYDLAKAKRRRNTFRKKDERKYQIFCVADLKNYHLFGGRD